MFDHAPQLHAALIDACTRPGMLRTHYQPIVDLGRGEVTGYEALTRFELEPRMGPDEWLATAHAVGIGNRVEAAALRSALASREHLPPNCFLTVNVSPDALVSDEVLDLLDDRGDLRGIMLELTEQARVEDYDALELALAPLRNAGAMLAIDDAGAGYASLTHVSRLRPDLVKIDRGHVSGVDRDPAKVAAVEALGQFASKLDAWVLAEGVETRAELELLVDLGVPLAQGWLLGKPSPAMAPPNEVVAIAHAERSARRTPGELGELLDHVVCVAAAVAEADASAAQRASLDAALAKASAAGVVVLVDEHQRPTGLAHRAAHRAPGPVLTALLDTRLTVLVERILARPEATRFDPVAVCDQVGRIAGLLTVEQILRALNGREPAAAAPADG